MEETGTAEPEKETSDAKVEKVEPIAATPEAESKPRRRRKKDVEVVIEVEPEPEPVVEEVPVEKPPLVIGPMKIFNERDSRNALDVYYPGKQTLEAITEEGRNIFAENLIFIRVEDEREKKRLRLKAIEMEAVRKMIKELLSQNKVEEEEVEDFEQEEDKEPVEKTTEKEEEEIFDPDVLKKLCVQAYAEQYQQGPIDRRVQYDDFVCFGENCNIELPVNDIVKLKNDIFWKRVVEAKHGDLIEFFKNSTEKYKHISNDMNMNWRQMGIEDKFAELIENLDPYEWNPIEFKKIIKAVKPYIKRLSIHQLIPMPEKSIEHNAYNKNYKLYHIPVRDCHHIPLDFIFQRLYNLTSLDLCVGIRNVQRAYDQRFFDFSYDDVFRLSSGLAKLEKLERIRIYHSRMDDRKLKILLKNILHLSIKVLDFSYCGLQNDSGKSIGYFLMKNETLTSLELQDNEIGPEGCEAIGYGLQNFTGNMVYFGIARNPIQEAGVISIGAGLVGSNHITEMNFSACDMDSSGAYRLIQIMAFHDPLIKFNMSSIPLDDGCVKKLLIVLEYNHKLLEFDCTACDGISEENMVLIKGFLKRNNIYHEYPEWDRYESDTTTIGWKYRLHHIYEKDICNSVSEPTIIKYKQKIDENIPKSGRRIYSTSLLLGRKFFYCSAPDRVLSSEKKKLFANIFEKNKYKLAKRMCIFAEKRRRKVYHCKRILKIRKLIRDRTYSKIRKRYLKNFKKARELQYRKFHFKDNLRLSDIGRYGNIGIKPNYTKLQYFPSL